MATESALEQTRAENEFLEENLDPNRWKALFVIAISQLMLVLDASIVNLAIPSAKADLGISDVNQQWIITAYTLSFGGLLLLGGRVADYMGRKKALMVGLIGFAAASAIGGISGMNEERFGLLMPIARSRPDFICDSTEGRLTSSTCT